MIDLRSENTILSVPEVSQNGYRRMSNTRVRTICGLHAPPVLRGFEAKLNASSKAQRHMASLTPHFQSHSTR